MDTFTQQIAQWQWFFGTVAASAATLTGLLFVSLSVNRSPAEPLKGARLTRARRSFGDFLFVLMMGLVFLVPHQVSGGLALALLVLGGARAAGIIREAGRRREAEAKRLTLSEALREYGLPALATLGLLVIAVEILRGATIAIFGMVLVVAALLVTASWNAWLLLVTDEVEGQ
jgi:hypothetical protein